MHERLIFRLRRARTLIQRGLRSLRVRGLRSSLAMISPSLKRQLAGSALAQLSSHDIEAVQQHNFQCPQPFISVIIPAYNQLELSKACLAALIKQCSPLAFEVIVVNDASTDASAAYFSALNGLIHIQQHSQQGFVNSCNVGAGIARGEYLVFLNNDTQIQPACLENLIGTFTSYPDSGVVGAKLIYPNGRLQEAGATIFKDASAWNIGRFENATDSAFNYVRECDYVSGAALAIRTDLFKKLHGFDSFFSPGYYEDADLCFRAREAGFKIRYQPHAMVMHIEGASSDTSADHNMKAFQTVHQEKFFQRWQQTLQVFPNKPEKLNDIEFITQRYQKKSVLFIDEQAPRPSHDSGSLRIFSLMKLFRDDNCAVSFISMDFEFSDISTPSLEAAGIQSPHHHSTQEKNILAWLKKNAGNFNLIIVSRVAVMDSLYAVLRKYAPAARLIFDTVDLHFLRETSEAALKQSSFLDKQAKLSREKELNLIQHCDETWVVSETELLLLNSICPEKTIRAISNIHAIYEQKNHFQQRQDIIFVGNFRHPPNHDGLQWFIESCWPLLSAELPDMKLHVIGAGLGVSQQQALQKNNIVFHGHVGDIQTVLDTARINIAPLRYGAGAKGKISQALACGLPTVATDIAADGMWLQHEASVLIASTAEHFADNIKRLYTDEIIWRKISGNGLKIAKQHFSETAAKQALQDLI
jgi:O-antigen biosynthesis protein